MLGCVTALGGGSMRDIVLGHYPLLWVKEPWLLALAGGSAAVTIALARVIHRLRVAFLVLDAIGLAGGLNPFAGRSRIKVIRRQGGAEAEFGFDFDRFVDGKDLAQNILLLPGDTVVVPEERAFWR